MLQDGMPDARDLRLANRIYAEQRPDHRPQAARGRGAAGVHYAARGQANRQAGPSRARVQEAVARRLSPCMHSCHRSRCRSITWARPVVLPACAGVRFGERARLMYTILQALLAPVAIAFSVFSLITYLWLGLTVLLIGDRRSLVTWVGGSGLLLGALFFLSHGALVGAGVPGGASASDVWWHISWLPAFGAPICWAAIGLHYAGLAGAWKRLRVIVIGGVAVVGALTALLALVRWPAIANYGDFIRLLDAALHFRRPEPSSLASSPLLPALGLAFVIYIALCASLPWL